MLSGWTPCEVGILRFFLKKQKTNKKQTKKSNQARFVLKENHTPICLQGTKMGMKFYLSNTTILSKLLFRLTKPIRKPKYEIHRDNSNTNRWICGCELLQICWNWTFSNCTLCVILKRLMLALCLLLGGKRPWICLNAYLPSFISRREVYFPLTTVQIYRDKLLESPEVGRTVRDIALDIGRRPLAYVNDERVSIHGE